MAQADQIEIPFSKKRMILPFLTSLAFVVAGMYGLFSSTAQNALAIIVVTFFGYCAATFLWMLIKKQSPIIVNRQGIFQETIGLILWQDIEFVILSRIRGIPFLQVVLNKTEANKDKSEERTVFRSMKAGFQSFLNSPGFDAGNYKMSAREIHRLLIDKLERYKAWQSQNNALSSPF